MLTAPARNPIKCTQPPMRIESRDLIRVPGPPTSMTWSTPRPPVWTKAISTFALRARPMVTYDSEHLLLPLGCVLVVDGVRRAELLGDLQLLVRRRSGNDICATGSCDLKTKATRKSYHQRPKHAICAHCSATYTETPPVPCTRTQSPPLMGMGPCSAL